MGEHADTVLEHAQELGALDQAMQWEVLTCITHEEVQLVECNSTAQHSTAQHSTMQCNPAYH